MKVRMFFKLCVFIITLVLTLTACTSGNETATLEVRLTDAPADFEEVNIDIQEVQVNNTNGGSGWESLEITPGVYNILELTNGLDTLLGSIELPAGRIQQIRLVLGDDNTVKVDGQTYSLQTPSAQQSGLKLNLNTTLSEGISYTILLDFDAARSVVERGNKKYLLKPVIRAVEEATSGAIKGAVNPIDTTPVIYAITGQDTVATAYTDAAGMFLIRGLDAGNYTVSVVPANGKATVTKSQVSVSIGAVTHLGIIEIP